MEFKRIADSILANVGSETNVSKVDHCATRLRFVIKDSSKVNVSAIREIDGVIDVEEKDTLQIVIGKEVANVYKELATKDNIVLEKEPTETVYNRAKVWQIAFFALNNTATNTYMFLMNFVSYYAVGIAGLGMALVGFLLTAMRLWDGITDPIIGFLIDKTDGKFGKFRPFMVLGNIILAVMVLLIYKTTHLVPESYRLIYFSALYLVYIVGYTFQTACTKAGQACLTNDPKQRPIFSMFDGVYNSLLFMGLQVYIASVLTVKHGGFTITLFDELVPQVIIASAFLTLLAVIGIWTKDRTEFFGLGQKAVKVKFRDYWSVIKNNRAIQMLVISASTDKLAGTVAQNSMLGMVLFGIIIGDYALSGTIGLVTMVPSLLLGLYGMNHARKVGFKKTMVIASWGGILFSLIYLALFIFGDPTQISLSNIGFMTIAFMVLYVLKGALQNVSSSIVIPMIADCSDYETYLTGRYVPGMMGTLFSFVDKFVSAFSSSIVAVLLAGIGYATVTPAQGDTLTPALFWVWAFCAVGLPVFGLLCNIISMKFYPCSSEKMVEVQTKIQEIKNQA